MLHFAEHRRTGLHDYDRGGIRGGVGAGRLYGHLEGRFCAGHCDDVRRGCTGGDGCHLSAGGRPYRRRPAYERLYEGKRHVADVVADGLVPCGDDSHDQLRHLGIAADGS